MKIDAPKGYKVCWQTRASTFYLEGPCRIVRESDWRKIMAVVKAAQPWNGIDWQDRDDCDLEKAVLALRKHLEKRK